MRWFKILLAGAVLLGAMGMCDLCGDRSVYICHGDVCACQPYVN